MCRVGGGLQGSTQVSFRWVLRGLPRGDPQGVTEPFSAWARKGGCGAEWPVPAAQASRLPSVLRVGTRGEPVALGLYEGGSLVRPWPTCLPWLSSGAPE